MLSVCLAGGVNADEFVNGTVVYVDDGDTAKVELDSGEEIKVRFYGIDSPEKKWPGRWKSQPYSKKAKQFMSSLILGRKVTVRLNGDTTHSRVVGEIFVEGKSASQEIVKQGLAWWNYKYAKNDSELERLQEEAKRNKRGLWRQKSPEAPWDFRRRHPRK